MWVHGRRRLEPRLPLRACSSVALPCELAHLVDRDLLQPPTQSFAIPKPGRLPPYADPQILNRVPRKLAIANHQVAQANQLIVELRNRLAQRLRVAPLKASGQRTDSPASPVLHAYTMHPAAVGVSWPIRWVGP
jgi:hypothetical protein